MISWTDPDTKNTVTHIEDYEHNIVFTNITDIATKKFYNLKSTIEQEGEKVDFM